MNKEIITFGDIEIEKHKFHHYKHLFFSENLDIDKIITSSKISPAEMRIIKLNHPV